MGTGIDTLCAQAFGAGNNRLVGVIFARGTLLTAFTFIPVAFLWYNMEYALLTLGKRERERERESGKETCHCCTCSILLDYSVGRQQETPNLGMSWNLSFLSHPFFLSLGL